MRIGLGQLSVQFKLRCSNGRAFRRAVRRDEPLARRFSGLRPALENFLRFVVGECQQ